MNRARGAHAGFSREELKNAPDWVEIEDYEAFTLDYTDETGGVRELLPSAEREMVVVLSGEVTAETEHASW